MFILWLIIYSVAFGVLSSIAVKSKNRDQVNWFFIGLFFGIFGFVAALIIDERDEKGGIEENDVLDFDINSLTKKCPDCAEIIKLEAKICRFCHHKFSVTEIEKQIADAKENFYQQEQPETTMIGENNSNECYQCGSVYFASQKYCTQCGAKLV